MGAFGYSSPSSDPAFARKRISSMLIGRLAELTGCTPKALRLYEAMGLISEPQRSGRYRVYNAHHLQMVRLIRRAQAAGFKLAEMGPLIAAKNALKAFPLALANQAVEVKRQQVQARIAELQTLDLHLAELKHEMNALFAQPPSCLHTAERAGAPDRQTPGPVPVAAGAE